MIAKLTGFIDEIGESWMIIDVNGVGYFVTCSSRTLSNFKGKGEEVSLYIEPLFRQDSLQLYGFFNIPERDNFRLLLSVQGVGGKMAIAILSILSPDKLMQAIATGDQSALQQVSGVGAKLAARILNELKDKVRSEDIPISAAGIPQKSPFSTLSQEVEDAVSALLHLGYKRAEALSAVAKAEASKGDNTLPLQDLIRLSLAYLVRAS